MPLDPGITPSVLMLMIACYLLLNDGAGGTRCCMCARKHDRSFDDDDDVMSIEERKEIYTGRKEL